jgi:hypothetical protein
MQKDQSQIKLTHTTSIPDAIAKDDHHQPADSHIDLTLKLRSTAESIKDIIKHMKAKPTREETQAIEHQRFNSFSEYASRNPSDQIDGRNQRFLNSMVQEISRHVDKNFDAIAKLPVKRESETPIPQLTLQNEKNSRAETKRHLELLRDYILNGAALTDKEITEDTELLRIALTLKSEFNKLMDKNSKLEKTLEKTLTAKTLEMGKMVRENNAIKALLLEQDGDEARLMSKNSQYVVSAKRHTTGNMTDIQNRNGLERLLKYTDKQIEIIAKNGQESSQQ